MHGLSRSFPGNSAGKESARNAGDPGSIPRLGRSPGEGIGYWLQYSWASLVAQTVKNPPEMGRHGFDPWVGKIAWRRAWQPTPVFLPGESPWTEETGGPQSIGSQRVGCNWATKHSTGRYAFKSFSSLSFSVPLSGMVLKRMVWFESGLTVLSQRWITWPQQQALCGAQSWSLTKWQGALSIKGRVLVLFCSLQTLSVACGI